MDRNILLADFARAVQKLTTALASSAQSDLENAGCFQYFKFCFELAWKNVRLAAECQGLGDCASPKAALGGSCDSLLHRNQVNRPGTIQ
jgi:hypothetical protein